MYYPCLVVIMNRAWVLFKSHPYISNVVGYTTLFATADLIQQSMLHSINWAQTARVALVGFCFHANFNYHWLRGLERMFPGGGIRRVSLKVFLDQLFAAPMTISAFYIGLSTLEGAEDPLEDWRTKFWTSYKVTKRNTGRTLFTINCIGQQCRYC
uniref:Si:ch211-120k19.1 n=1 Tax=Sinocyclocheilus rhinocerous TaxID=307959 RepID=A0A673HKZ2_9TELE